jgi:hypothetical protein
MGQIKFPLSSAPGPRPQESGGRLINAFVERAPIGAASDTIIRRSPGLRRVALAQGLQHTRGFLDCAGTQLLWILNDRVVVVNSSFVVTDLGKLTGIKPVTTARNNALPPNNLVVTEEGCFNLFTVGAPTPFVGGDMPGNPTSVCELDGYFIWTFQSGYVYASDLNSVTVNPLSFNVEQGLIARRAVRYAGRLFVFGDKWTGLYRNAGTVPFPFARETTIAKGIVGTHAIAGWEAGWSNALIWAGDDFVVYQLNGYNPVPISTDDVSRDIQKAILAGRRDFIEAFVYMYNNNAFWVLQCHDLWTWEYNLSTGAWNERKSFQMVNWRGNRGVRMFDRWLTGGDQGELFEVSGTYFREALDPLIWHVESGVMSGFPQRTVIPNASFYITSAVGDFALEAKPRVAISWSLDGGHNWGRPVLRSLGAPGESRFYPSVRSSGLSRGHGVRYRLVVSDPVHVGLVGGMIDPQPRGVVG